MKIHFTKIRTLVMLLLVSLLFSSQSFAQRDFHGRPHPRNWRDSIPNFKDSIQTWKDSGRVGWHHWGDGGRSWWDMLRHRIDSIKNCHRDSGRTRHDSGWAGHDSGHTWHDSGWAGHDSGHADHDSGWMDDDSGHTDHDSGWMDDDSGHADHDSGWMDDDSGHTWNDSGHMGGDSGRNGNHHGGKRMVDPNSNLTVNVQVYPNPVMESATIYIENSSGNVMFRLYESNGKLAMEKTLTNGAYPLSKDKLGSGVYFYQVIDNDIPVSNGRLIFQ